MNQESDVADVEIVRRVLAGDTESFRAVVERYQGRVLGLGFRFLRNREAAEDYSQEVFLRVFRSLHTFRGESRFYSWLMRVAYHMAIDASISHRRKGDDYSNLDDFEPVDASRTPEEQFLFHQTRSAVRQAMQELPPYHAICIDLYFFFDLRYDEISLMTGFPINTIKSHVRRAKTKLRAVLEGSIAEV